MCVCRFHGKLIAEACLCSSNVGLKAFKAWNTALCSRVSVAGSKMAFNCRSTVCKWSCSVLFSWVLA